jgi:uncharacterized protein with HEPN domain
VSTAPTGIAELEQALEALTEIAVLRDEGRHSFDSSEQRRWALAYLWINVGSALKQFCRRRAITQASSPFPGAIRMRDRLCYRPPSTISPRILWDTCLHDTDPLTALLRDLRAAL